MLEKLQPLELVTSILAIVVAEVNRLAVELLQSDSREKNLPPAIARILKMIIIKITYMSLAVSFNLVLKLLE